MAAIDISLFNCLLALSIMCRLSYVCSVITIRFQITWGATTGVVCLLRARKTCDTSKLKHDTQRQHLNVRHVSSKSDILWSGNSFAKFTVISLLGPWYSLKSSLKSINF